VRQPAPGGTSLKASPRMRHRRDAAQDQRAPDRSSICPCDAGTLSCDPGAPAGRGGPAQAPASRGAEGRQQKKSMPVGRSEPRASPRSIPSALHAATGCPGPFANLGPAETRWLLGPVDRNAAHSPGSGRPASKPIENTLRPLRHRLPRTRRPDLPPHISIPASSTLVEASSANVFHSAARVRRRIGIEPQSSTRRRSGCERRSQPR